MAWFKKERPEKLTSETPAKKVKIPEGLWVKCDNCKEIIYRKEVENNFKVCPKCDYHFRITASERLPFLAFAGEEKGLLGSRAYTLNPALPLENTVAMINLVMIGRNSIDSLFIVGAVGCPELAEITRQENSSVGFTFGYDNTVTGRSDHASFVRKGVPSIAYFSGFHSDYHKVVDNPDLVEIAKDARVAQLAFRTALHIANDDRTYSIQKPQNP